MPRHRRRLPLVPSQSNRRKYTGKTRPGKITLLLKVALLKLVPLGVLLEPFADRITRLFLFSFRHHTSTVRYLVSQKLVALHANRHWDTP